VIPQPKKEMVNSVKKFLLLSLMGLSLSGCMVSKYDGPPSATMSSYMQARYQCIQEARMVSVGGGYVGEYGGGFSSASAPSCGMISTCMALRGFVENPKGRFSPPEGTVVSCIK
jgi:hypothetical protein